MPQIRGRPIDLGLYATWIVQRGSKLARLCIATALRLSSIISPHQPKCFWLATSVLLSWNSSRSSKNYPGKIYPIWTWTTFSDSFNKGHHLIPQIRGTRKKEEERRKRSVFPAKEACLDCFAYCRSPLSFLPSSSFSPPTLANGLVVNGDFFSPPTLGSCYVTAEHASRFIFRLQAGLQTAARKARSTSQSCKIKSTLVLV